MPFFRYLQFLFLVGFIWLVGFGFFTIHIIKQRAIVGSRADAIIVLTGDKKRINTGMKLLKNNYAKHLFVSGVDSKASLEDISMHLDSFQKEDFEQLKPHIELGYSSNTTLQNAEESAEWIKKNNYHSIILVTSNYHMPRSLKLFKKLIPNVQFTPYPIVNNHRSIKGDIILISIEYNKFLYSLIK